MPIEGTISVVGAAPVVQQPTLFKPSAGVAPHAAEVNRVPEGADPKAAEGADPKAAEGVDPKAAEGVDPKAGEGGAADPKPDAWRLAALAQKEKAARKARDEARQAEQGLKARSTELEAREARLREVEAQQQQRMEMYRQNPLELLKAYGLDYNQVSEFVARGDWTPEQAQALQLKEATEAARTAGQKVEALRKETAERETAMRKELAERDQRAVEAQAQAAVSAFRKEIRTVLEAEPETYELSSRQPEVAIDAIYEYTEEQFEKTGKMPSRKEAADYVENKLYEELKKIVEGTKKFAPGKKPGAGPARTLTHKMTPAAAGASPEERDRPETEAERRARVTAEIAGIWAARRK